jgi:uncharacterized protein (TIGR03437 family)
MIKSRYFFAALAAGILTGALQLAAQTLGNTSLQGVYFVRYLGADTNNNPQSFQGTFTFDGKGGFQVTGQGTSTVTSNHSLQVASTGDYQVLSSGVVNLLNPFEPSGKTRLHGGMGAGVLVASSRNSSYDDFLVAFPASTAGSNATLSGSYRVASMDFLNGDVSLTRGTFFSVTADGKGGLGNVMVSGSAVNLANINTVQTSAGATYSVTANGSGTLNLPAPTGVAANTQLLAGNKTLYASSDGSVFIAGSASTYDIIIGIKANAGNAPQLALQGLYFRVYLEDVSNGPAVGDQSIWDGQGAVNEVSSLRLEVGNDRTNYNESVYSNAGNPNQPAGEDYMYAGDLTLAADGTTADGRALGAGGNLMLSGSVDGSNGYAIALRVKAPSLSGSGVFLNPQGVVNAASSAPFTSPVAPGEFITLYGTGMASQTATAASLPFPTTLGDVTVTVNGSAMPLQYVSPTQISGVVPYSTPTDDSFLNVQVNNAGTASNVVQVYSGYASPGIFTVPPGGIGNGAILHADYSLVTPAKPAKVGETVLIFLTGLGPVTPPVAAGAAAPTNPLSQVPLDAIAMDIDGWPATIQYAGLAPGMAGLYQLNVTIPFFVRTGNMEIDIVIGPPTTDYWSADYDIATIPIGK